MRIWTEREVEECIEDWDGICPKCYSKFERPDKPSPAGHLCPV
jgi:hypothetical protein